MAKHGGIIAKRKPTTGRGVGTGKGKGREKGKGKGLLGTGRKK